ncbi:tyrosinase precursor [Cordyceps militaris CM01]|uniref:tyrosinase n=1 Tax=Cordyceps militaris (strain CM01) TaxID=983644 RepID=G3JB66_CORMM|nr:tyrosinase precursor [Cordyceps militaris CM01]EGX94426.1 tyrosinase precursor [Cordyceps militaris CM01]
MLTRNTGKSLHRLAPSLRLAVRVLVKQAKSLAAGYPENVRSTYQKAADDLRAPYWDWALEPDLPSVILPETITAKVATETGVVAKDIVNPLYTYIFPKETLNGKFGQFQPGERVYRCSTTTQANNNLHNSNLKASLFDAFVRAKSFSDFSTYSAVGNSVEGVHNSVHLDAGCAGQFIDSEYSAFDPLFMLHHANVDRLWAYWQSIHPEKSTFNGTYSGKSRFNSAEGTMITLDSPLQPFRQVNGEWHTSSTVNDIKVLGYAYQGLEYWTKSAAEMQASALKTVNSLYGDKEEEKTTEPSSKESAVTTSQESTVTTSAQSAVTTSQQSIETSNTQSIPPQPKGTTTSILTSSKPSENTGSSTVSSSTAAETSSPLTTSSSQPGHGACIAPSTTTSMAARAHAALKVRAKGSYKRFYAGIAVDVAYLPVRPCQIEIFLDKWRAGSMAIMKMPERGVVYDSISLKDAIASAKLGGVADDELLRRIQTRISANLRKVEVEVVEMVAASSDLELPTVIKSDKHVVLDKSVSGSAAH